MADSAKSNRPLIELELLRAISTVADSGSFTAAAARLYSTQSTISQKVRRLEELTGHTLLTRGSRDILPTDAGETLLNYARRMLSLNDELLEALSGVRVELTVRLAVPEDFAAERTTQILAAFKREHPGVKLEVTSGCSRAMSATYDRGELDLIVVKQRRNSREAVASWPEQLRWVDSATHPTLHLDPVPLAMFPPRGLYRDDIINAIERSGRRWRIAFTSSGLSGLQAAVADGLGISLLPERAVTAGHTVLPSECGLPPIDTFDIAMIHRPTADPVIKTLAAALSDMLNRDRG